eukprot:6720757-Prymnesium_polylepis.1
MPYEGGASDGLVVTAAEVHEHPATILAHGAGRAACDEGCGDLRGKRAARLSGARSRMAG